MNENAFAWFLITIGAIVLLWVLSVSFDDYRQRIRRINDCHQKSGEIFVNEGGEYLCLDPKKIGQ
jgi:hypothetical protein